MTRVNVKPGICGFPVTITAEKDRDKRIHISLDTDCEMLQGMRDDISILEMKSALKGLMGNPVYSSAARCIKHVACPVPAAILKAVEVEVGACIPKDVSITFTKE